MSAVVVMVLVGMGATAALNLGVPEISCNNGELCPRPEMHDIGMAG